jgi:hypothetical protein
MSRLALRLFVLCTLVLAANGSGQTDERRLAISEEPFLEMFSLKFDEGSEAQSRPAIYEQGPFAFNSIPSIARAPDGRLFLAWIAETGFARGGRIVGAYSSDGGRTWGAPLELINKRDRSDGDPVIIVDGQHLRVISTSSRLPEGVDKFNPWPVRFDRTWWYMTSTEDDGKTWSKPVEVKCPHLYAGKRSGGYKLKDGTVVLPYYYETAAERGRVPRLEGDMRVVAGMLRSRDGGRTWVSGQMVDIPDSKAGADEPATVLLSSGEIFCLLRNDLDRFYETRSLDGGLTWNPPKPSPLAAHNAPAWVHRLEDRPGDELIVGWDNSTGSGRWPLVVAHSLNGGRTWSDPKLISNPNPQEGFRADYPTICQTKDGIIVLAWQEETLPRHLGKEIRLARFNRAWLMLK